MVRRHRRKMKAQEKIQRGYMIKDQKIPDSEGTFVVSYTPRRLQEVRKSGKPKKLSEFKSDKALTKATLRRVLEEMRTNAQ